MLPLTIPKSLAPIPFDDESLSTFLAKPIPIYSNIWTQASASFTSLVTANVGTQLTGNAIWANKLSGFRYFRGTAVLRLQLNAQPFHQGRLLLSFLPLASAMPLYYGPWHYSDLAAATQLPNVELDCRDATSELRIPYVSPTSYYSLVDGTVDWGRFNLHVLSPLVSGDGSSVQYTFWLSFEDCEFASPINPQSGAPPARGRKKKTHKVIRMGQTHQKDEHAAAMSEGPVTSFLGKAQGVANVLSGIPVISGLASSAGWVMGIAKGVTGVFGWSKPQNDSVAKYEVPRPYRNAFHCNGMSNTESLSLISGNEISGLPGFSGTDVDEMSFGYLKTIEAYGNSFDWATSATTGTELKFYTISPRECGLQRTFVGTANTVTTATYCPMFKISQHYLFWRGTIKMHIKFIKTDYHSGRVSVSYTPGVTATRPTNATAAYVLREVVDIRECSEVIFELPYMLNLPYVRNGTTGGVVTISVLNELRAPTTCAQYISCLVYWSAGDDFEVAVPKPTNARNIVPQSGELNDETLLVDKPIGNAPAFKWDHDTSQFCVGEVATSVKMMINRLTSLRWTATFAGTGTYYPFSWALPTYSSATGTKSYSPVPVDVLGEIALGYAVFRGGLNIGLNSVGTGDTAYRVSPVLKAAGEAFANSTANSSTSPSGLVSTTDENAAYAIFPSTVFGGCMVKMPYYNQTHLSPVYPTINGETVFAEDYTPQFRMAWASNASQTELMRGASEDFQFGYFIGWGPQIIAYS